ncbi:TPA: hypothetical protein QCY77_004524 [Bacillus cereus]|nr:hypothetical protein [Bacillus cereus]
MYYDLFRRDKYEWNTRSFSKDIFEILRNKIKTNKIKTNKIKTNKIKTNKIKTNKIKTNKIKTNKINELLVLKNLLE